MTTALIIVGLLAVAAVTYIVVRKKEKPKEEPEKPQESKVDNDKPKENKSPATT